jgi:hypothetical protein
MNNECATSGGRVHKRPKSAGMSSPLRAGADRRAGGLEDFKGFPLAAIAEGDGRVKPFLDASPSVRPPSVHGTHRRRPSLLELRLK